MHKIVSDYIKGNNLNIFDQDDTKPWGGYYIFAQGDDYDQKILWVKPRNLLSLQYHGTPEHLGHKEEVFVLNKFRIVLSKSSAVGKSDSELEELINNLRVVDLNKGGEITTPSGFLHAYVNPFDEDIYFIEKRISSNKESSKDREENITRIYDSTQRYNTPNYPIELYQKLMTK